MNKASFAAIIAAGSTLIGLAASSFAQSPEEHASKTVPDSVVAGRRSELSKAALAANSGPQSPRDIANPNGANQIVFSAAPNRKSMNLCNIHFHEAAEHRGGDFTTYVGNGDGKGHESGYRYNGMLTADELKPLSIRVGLTEHGELLPGDTIEIHFVHSTAHVKPGPTLASCLSK